VTEDLTRRRRILILAEGRFSVLDAKTATCVLRYRGDEVVGVLDSQTAGRTAGEVVGVGGGVPVVATLEEGLALRPDTLLVGVAPRGGRLPAAWLDLLRRALERGLEVVSGLHTFLSDEPELAAAAASGGGRIRDLRRVPDDLPVASGLAATVPATVVLTVGSDCNVGKMTAAMELVRAARRAGRRAAFAPTGQTGLFLGGWGLAVDRVISDFVAGAAERIVLENARGADLVVVEGQGAILHPGYSGVTLGLLHGSMPDAMVLVHQPTRACTLNDALPIPPLPELIRLYESLAAPLKPARVVAIAINGFDLDDRALAAHARRLEDETGLPAADPVRSGAGRLLEPILATGKTASRLPAPGRDADDDPARSAAPPPSGGGAGAIPGRTTDGAPAASAGADRRGRAQAASGGGGA
jgi:uncharacterized NAD-dependent epimerase/dehydratase family protein